MALQVPASWSTLVARLAEQLPGSSPSFSGEESVLLPDLQQPQLILQRDQTMLHAGPDQEIWHKNSSHSKTGTQSVIKFSSVDSAYSQIKAEHTA